MYKDLTAQLRLFETVCRHSEKPDIADLVRCAWQAIEKLQTPQWIPVTERLPEIGEKVLVFAYSNDTFTARMCEQTENGYPVFECNGIFLETAKPGRITHWMQIPELPKEMASEQYNKAYAEEYCNAHPFL